MTGGDTVRHRGIGRQRCIAGHLVEICRADERVYGEKRRSQTTIAIGVAERFVSGPHDGMDLTSITN